MVHASPATPPVNREAGSREAGSRWPANRGRAVETLPRHAATEPNARAVPSHRRTLNLVAEAEVATVRLSHPHDAATRKAAPAVTTGAPLAVTAPPVTVAVAMVAAVKVAVATVGARPRAASHAAGRRRATADRRVHAQLTAPLLLRPRAGGWL